jgi:hypothetical protein
VLPVAEAAGNAAVEFDEAVDRFGAAVVRAAGVEVGQERLAPLLERLAESLDLRDRAGRQRREDFSRILDTVGDYAAVGSVVARRAS